MDYLGIDINLESSRLEFHGPPDSSRGALLSGKVRLIVSDPETEIMSIQMDLTEILKPKRSISKKCPECRFKITTVHYWHILPGPESIRLEIDGVHEFAFSAHLEGHLPATSLGSLGSIEYELRVLVSTPTNALQLHSTPLRIGRALKPMGDQIRSQHHIPLDVSSKLTLPSQICSFSPFDVQLEFFELSQEQDRSEMRWYICGLKWQIEEHSSSIFHACPAHQDKLGLGERDNKDTRMHMIGYGGIYHDFNTYGRQTKVKFPAIVDSLDCASDVESPTGFEVYHRFVLTAYLSEHHFSTTKPGQTHPMEHVKTLRMESKVVLTERAAHDIDWDQEQPPLHKGIILYPRVHYPFQNVTLSGDAT